ncbi:hypothetical protein GCM10015535_38280 [Streptomyces gelaticus]|uniref:Resolvase/invertase-type recombinase catalytic domain-containing protein n=1 Tax=Streptomyces gelaticus TaxID=285446 RepID=A0ABQ2W3G4_9ACTN|nr:hypothetical protein [Streptomyces gelaticus]GGV87976.1 hypothetical protein GCM10015535_38280 [Streptomyces gelaticus]
MEPLTEHRPVNGPVVYGFLRLVRVSQARQDALVASLAEYCRSHELQLSGVFTDRDAVARPSEAFAGLLDVLAVPDVYGVVAPAMSHLGPKAIAAERGRRIESAGSRLLLVRRPRPTHPSVSPSVLIRRRHPGTTRVLDAES